MSTPVMPNACPTCGRTLGSVGGAHGCATVAVVTNGNGKTVYQRWVNPQDSKDYCWLCQRIHRNHAGVALVCIWTQAEIECAHKLPAVVQNFAAVDAMLATGRIFSPLTREGKQEGKARKAGTTTMQAPQGVCSACHNGPLDPLEQQVGQCRACQATAASIGQSTLTPAPTVHVAPTSQQSAAAARRAGGRRGTPLVPGAGRPKLTVGQGAGNAPVQASPPPVVPVAIGQETPEQRKARILAALKAKK